MKILKWAVALSVSAAGLYFALKDVHWHEIREAVAALRNPERLLLCLGSSLVIFSSRSLRWKKLMDPLAPGAGWRTYFPISSGGFFLNNILPFRAGELARVVWTRRKTGAPVSAVFSVLAVERVFDMVTLLIFLLVIVLQKPYLASSSRLVGGLAAAVAGAFAVVFLLARRPSLVTGSALFMKLPARARGLALQFIDGTAALKNTGVLALLMAVSCLFWAVDIKFMQIAAHLFSIPLSWTDAAWLMCVFCLGAALPSAPGYVGTLEASGVAALGLLGYEAARVLPYILTLHITQMAATAFWGVPSLFALGSFRDDTPSAPAPSRRQPDDAPTPA
jgi:uncharacterized protein (TIRG00374 family)